MRRADRQARRRATLNATRRLTALLHECAEQPDVDAVVASVAKALTDVLELEGCWFEVAPNPGDLPVLGPDGELIARVRRWVTGGLLLPPLAAIPVGSPEHVVGRFVLESNGTVGISAERRMIAVAMAQLRAVVGHQGCGGP